MRTRRADPGDVAAVGALVIASLNDAPSSVYAREDLALDALEIGRDLVEAAIAAGDVAWILETGDQVAGVAVARRRALIRASHIGDLSLLVHPLARGRGCGRTLMQAVIEAARRSATMHKLALRIASDDEALTRIVLGCGAPWVRERVEVGMLRRRADILDMVVWGLVVENGPSPRGG